MTADYLDKLFVECAQGAKLLADIREFYGSTFKFSVQENLSGTSHFVIDTGAETLRFREASIRLNTSTNRIKAAAIHEALHLSLPTRRFNVIHAITLRPEHAPDFARIDETIRKTVNIVQHDIFVNEFVAMGFPLSEFIVRRPTAPRYAEEAKSFRGKVLIPDHAWIAWSWWAFEYFNNYLSIKHGDDSAELLAQNAATWGSRVLPGFQRKAEEIRDWAADQRHQQPETYMDALRRLFEIMQLPANLQFCSLVLAPGEIPHVHLTD